MSTISTISTRTYANVQNRLSLRNEAGQAASEYGVVVLVAIALALGVFAIVRGHAIDGVLEALMKKALTTATGLLP